MMESEWKVATNLINWKRQYAVYRLTDTNEVDHSGNRTYASDFTPDRQTAVELAHRLNVRERIE